MRVKGEGRVKWSGLGAWYGAVNEERGGEGMREYSGMEYGVVGYGKWEDMGWGKGW